MKNVKELQPDLFEDEPLTPERLLWLSLSELREGHHKLRKRFFKEFDELKKENRGLKKEIFDIQMGLNQYNIIENDLFEVAK